MQSTCAFARRQSDKGSTAASIKASADTMILLDNHNGLLVFELSMGLLALFSSSGTSQRSRNVELRVYLVAHGKQVVPMQSGTVHLDLRCRAVGPR
jgi:hypothetical protein